MYSNAVSPSFGLVFFPDIKEKTAELLILAEMFIMFVTLVLYIPQFNKMRRSWDS